ncbi:MAG: 3-isopropylmalate dehydratase small subunit [Bacteroidales bacterium]|nr:3-isopropylmalate dehydratase small subunit [Bacteroidales bacterium]
MAKEELNILESTCVPLAMENVNTDQIMPARFLKFNLQRALATTCSATGDLTGMEDLFETLSSTTRDTAGKSLVAGKNFGCGSSREHAVWAVYDYGFRVVISSFFADIFRNNALNNGLLPLIIPEEEVKSLMTLVTSQPGTIVRINVQERRMEVPSSGQSFNFEINSYKLECLVHGLDDIDYLINMRSKIAEYETRRGGLG